MGSIEEALRGESLERTVDFARRALASDVLESEDRMYLASALAALVMAGMVDEALAGISTVIAAAQRSGDRLVVAGHQLWRGLAHYEAGELLRAEEDLILEPTPFWQASTPLTYRAAFLTQVLLERGQFDEAQKLAAGTALDDVQDVHRIHFRYGRGRLRLESGAPENALVEFLEAGAVAESVDIHNPAFVPWRSQAALAMHRLGRQREAREWHGRSRAVPSLGRTADGRRVIACARAGPGRQARRAAVAGGGRCACALARTARACARARGPRCSAAPQQQPQRGAAVCAKASTTPSGALPPRSCTAATRSSQPPAPTRAPSC